MCVVPHGFQPSWFLGSLWSLWPPRNIFQEHNNQISGCRLELGEQREAEGAPATQTVSVHRSLRIPWGRVRQNRPPAPFDKAPSHKTGCLYPRPGGYSPTACTLPAEIPAVEQDTHPDPATNREPPLVCFTLQIPLHGNL